MSTRQWANIGEDTGALHALITRIPEHVPVSRIHQLWIFPPRRIATGESIVVVVAAFEEDPARRRVSTVHFTIARDRRGSAQVTTRFAEHASATLDAIPRVVQGVLRRLGEDIDASPREEHIDAEPARWQELIVELGGRPPDRDAREPASDAGATNPSPEPNGPQP